MRVRSSAASACGEVRAAGGQRHFGPGRRGQPVGGERLAQRGARLIEPLLGLVDGIARLVDVGLRRAVCGAPCSARSNSSRRLHELALGVGHAVLGGSAILGRLARGNLGVVALALAHGDLGERGIARARSAPRRRGAPADRPAATLSLSATSTSAMRPGTCAPMRTSPPDGSTRPGGRGRPAASWRRRLRLGRRLSSLARRRPSTWRLSIAGLALNVCGT